MEAGDTAWLLTSAALVLFMTPGLAFFYGGMVRSKNVLAMLMKNYVAMGVVTITWIVIGFSLAFSGDVGGVVDNRWSALIERIRTPAASACSRMRAGGVPSLIATPERSLRIST